MLDARGWKQVPVWRHLIGERRPLRETAVSSTLREPRQRVFEPAFFFSSIFCGAGCGSKQRRQRASYISPAPTTISSSEETIRWVCTAGFPQRTQMARSLVISSATASSRGIGSNGRP